MRRRRHTCWLYEIWLGQVPENQKVVDLVRVWGGCCRMFKNGTQNCVRSEISALTKATIYGGGTAKSAVFF